MSLRATVSLDLDDLWTYLKTRGDPTWASYPSYLPVIVPRVLSLLDELKLPITFFVVGRDAAAPANAEWMRALSAHGHEIGNHSYEHDCWLHRYRRDDLEADIRRAEDSIEAATGRQPKGFRGPGFSWSTALLEILAARGYAYDASTLPTIVGPLARMYFLWSAGLTREQRQERKALFGTFDDAIRPVDPYRWDLVSGRRLLEIPVTTMPGTRLPFHLSYLLYLESYSTRLMKAYLSTAIGLCRAWGVEPSFLLHPLDLLGPTEAPGLEFFPGMTLEAERKADVFRYALGSLQRHFDVVTLESFAVDVARSDTLQLRRAHRSFDPSSQPLGTEATRRFERSAVASSRFRLEPPESLTPANTEVYRET
jgi:hypothetical protein